MVLPEKEEGFELQAVLALQHLVRIGMEMKVRWFGSVVAYLPRYSPSNLNTIQEQAAIAAQAWISLHSEKSEIDDDDDEEGERDLWEEKYMAGRDVRGAEKDERRLPDFEIVAGGEREQDGAKEETVPPFFAVEVEELPRGAGIEWHVGLGVTDGPVQVSPILSFLPIKT